MRVTSIHSRVLALLVASTAGTAALVGWSMDRSFGSALTEAKMEELRMHANLAGGRFLQSVEAVRADVLFLASTPAVKGLIRAHEGGGVDPLDGSRYPIWLQRLQSLFVAMMRAEPTYAQLRLIGVDDDGRELVRVERRNEQPWIVPEEDLQSKNQRRYFVEAVRRPAGSVYLSEINLNREHGRVTEPHTPTLRAAVPIHASAGRVFGILVINVDLNRWFRELHELTPDEHDLFLSNDSGDWLIHPDVRLEFGFDLGERHRVGETFGPLPIPTTHEASVRTVTTDVGSPSVALKKLFFDPERRERFVLLAQTEPHSIVIRSANQARRSGMLLASLSVVFTLLCGVWFAANLTRPLRRITGGILRFADGDIDVTLPEERSDEVGILARAFATLRTEVSTRTLELERSNRELGNFAYVASHDLKEPLRVITGYLELLKENYEGRLDGEADEFITVTLDASSRMKKLIDGLLSYSRAGSQERPHSAVALDDVLSEVCQNLKLLLEENGASLVAVGPLPSVHGDGGRLVQLFQNLITNSVKYRSDAPPVIRIDAEALESTVRVRVHDNGIGIEPDQHERIFEMFRRSQSAEGVSGSGIGLATCKRIVEGHGGRIWVESDSGGGSTFYVTLPEATPASLPREAGLSIARTA